MSASGTMHPKTKAFADMLIANPKMSQTDAWLKTHKTINRRTANDLASKVARSANVKIYMQKHVNDATRRIVSISTKGEDNVALKAAQDILDRTYGKAVSKSENINLNISMEEALNMLE